MSVPAPTTIPADDATPLALYRWIPAAPKAVVQVAHGMAEHAARYDELATALNAAGYAVYASDHRGHGATAPDPSQRGVFAPAAGWSCVVRDLRSVTTHIEQQHPGLPVFLVGHSLGSVLARDVAIRYGRLLSGVILTGVVAPMGAMAGPARLLARLESKRRGRQAPSPLLDKLSFASYNSAFKPNRTDYDWLSRDAAAVDAYVADPACGFVSSAGLFEDVIGGIGRVYRPSLLRSIPRDLPFLVLAGSQDPVAKQGRTALTVARLLRRAGVLDVESVVYPGARHELFNETNRDQVTRDVVAWLDRHLPAKPKE